MGTPYQRAPHQRGVGAAGSDVLHAALLIDFDNVTMGMRSDLSKELKTLLDFRYRLSRTSWQGIRFSFRGKRMEAVWLNFRVFFLNCMNYGKVDYPDTITEY